MKSFLALAVLYISVENLVFGVQAAVEWPYLSAQPVHVPLAWLIAGKLVWGIVFGVTAWGVWRLKAWGRKLLLIGATLYQVHIWINHLLFDTVAYAWQVRPFQVGITLITLAVVWGYMCLPDVRRLYSRN
jgi:uncharacterized membrane protein (DUF2068 family)